MESVITCLTSFMISKANRLSEGSPFLKLRNYHFFKSLQLQFIPLPHLKQHIIYFLRKDFLALLFCITWLSITQVLPTISMIVAMIKPMDNIDLFI